MHAAFAKITPHCNINIGTLSAVVSIICRFTENLIRIEAHNCGECAIENDRGHAMRFCWIAVILLFVAMPQGFAQSLLGEDQVFQNAAYGNSDAVEQYLLTGNNPNSRD